jgi:exodeoxyribonuclease VII large subunit
VALLAVPVIASVGHHTDRTLLDDVAAVSCSTPTHAAEAAVPIDCNRARAEQLIAAGRLAEHARRVMQVRSSQAQAAVRLREHGRRAVLGRARSLALLSRAPAAHLERQRSRLHQQLREIRAGSRRRLAEEGRLNGTRAIVISRKADSTLHECRERRPRELERLAMALAGHDPQRTLERGYVLASATDGSPLANVAAARQAGELSLRFADGEVGAKVSER